MSGKSLLNSLKTPPDNSCELHAGPPKSAGLYEAVSAPNPAIWTAAPQRGFMYVVE